MHLRNCVVTLSLIGTVLTLASCAYRLPDGAPPSHGLIRIVADSPEQYSVQVNTGTVKQYDVPPDGRVKIEIPSYRPTGGVYLFNASKLWGDSDPLKSWNGSITRNGKSVRKQSLRVTQKCLTDDAGYHIVKIAK